MTTPDERAYSIEKMGKAVEALIPFSIRKTRKPQRVLVPLELIENAVRALRHYPMCAALLRK